jgi:glycosyltransferase involved in cell wall biosynthesis
MNPEFPHPEIFINGRFLTQQITGVQSFAHSICFELQEAGIPFKFLVPADPVPSMVTYGAEVIQVGNSTGHFWEQIQLAAYLRERPDSVLINLCNSAPMNLKNQIVTVHDLAFHFHPEWFNWKFRFWYNFMIPRAVRSARRILTVSETSAGEIRNSYGARHSDIFITGNKVSHAFLQAEIDTAISEKIHGHGFFLLVGSNDPRKNFEVAEKFISGYPGDSVLVMAGGSHESFARVRHSSSDKVIRLGYVTSGELKWLYQNAIALINPSLYEGFGIPNLEAMSQHCPVICSDIPVFREVCGEAAFYFNPDDPESLKNQALQLQSNPELITSKNIIGNSIFTSYQNSNRASVILKAISK